MRTWPALLLAPLLALADQSVAYSLVTWSCMHQDRIALNLVHAAFLAGAIACTWPAWRRFREGAAGAPIDEAEAAGSRPAMMAATAAGVGGTASLVIAAMWLPTWILPACTG